MNKEKLANLVAIEYPRLIEGYSYTHKKWIWNKDEITYYKMTEIIRFLTNNETFALSGVKNGNIIMMENKSK